MILPVEEGARTENGNDVALICPLFGKSCKLDASIRSVDLDGQERRFLPVVSCYAAYGIEAVHASVGHDRELKKIVTKYFEAFGNRRLKGA